MIIELKMSIGQLQKIPSQDCENLLTKVAAASIEGIHLFLIPLRTANWISENIAELSVTHRRHITSLGREYAELAPLKFETNTALHIIEKCAGVESHGENFWSIGYKELIDSNYLSDPAAVVENIKYDKKIYEIIFGIMEKRAKTKYNNLIRFNYEFHHGGGSSTADLFEYLIDRKKIIVCICDTDFLVPDGAPANNSTYSLVLDREKELKGEIGLHENPLFLGKIRGTPCRELENFLSLDIILKTSKQTISGSADRLKALIENQSNVVSGDCLYLFFDLKKGVKLHRLIKSCRNNDAKLKWVESKYDLPEGSLSQKDISSVELAEFEMDGFGNGIIGSFLQHADGERMLTQHMESDYWKLHFQDWFESFMWYFCSGIRTRS